MTDQEKRYLKDLAGLCRGLDDYIRRHQESLDALKASVTRLRHTYGFSISLECADCPAGHRRPAELVCAACQTPVCWWHSHDSQLCLKCYRDDLTGLVLVREVDHDGPDDHTAT